MRLRTFVFLIATVVVATMALAQSRLDSAVYPGAANGEASYQRLANVAKFWAFVKFIHPRVHAPEVDWDQAFKSSAPKVLQAKTESAYAAAVEEMLAALHDPSTRVLAQGEPADPAAADRRIVLTTRTAAKAIIVSLEPGTEAAADAAAAGLAGKLAGAEAVVFDLRGSRAGAIRVPSSFLIARRVRIPSIPSLVSRVHYGYASLNNQYAAYHSSWDTQPSVKVAISGLPVVRTVFLVNSSTSIPLIALAIQSDGTGAIVSEDALSYAQVHLAETLPVDAALRARVRMKELVYADGTTDLSANAVLKKAGDDALNAVEMARSGNWPHPSARPRFNYPAAIMFDDGYPNQSTYPAVGYRLLAAARIWGIMHFFHAYSHL